MPAPDKITSELSASQKRGLEFATANVNGPAKVAFEAEEARRKAEFDAQESARKAEFDAEVARDEAEFDAAEQAKLADDPDYGVKAFTSSKKFSPGKFSPGKFVPVDEEEYGKARIGELWDGYALSERESRISDPVNQQLIRAVAGLPPEQMSALLEQIRKSVG